jgi:AraC-like DNA-binding protein
LPFADHLHPMNHPLPLTRVAGFLPFVRFLERQGVPVQTYLRRARIPIELLAYPQVAIPLNLAYRFIELCCRSEDIPHLGLWAGQATGLDDLGAFGRTLRNSLTVREYLRKGICLIGTMTPGQRFWLTEHGNALRLHFQISGRSALGRHQAELYNMIITINQLRVVDDAGWSPSELSLSRPGLRRLPSIEALADTRITAGRGESFFTLPRTMLDRPFRQWQPSVAAGSDTSRRNYGPLPDDFIASIEYLIKTFLIVDGYPDINLAAEAAGMSKRNLQRRLAARGRSYSQMVNGLRIDMAAEWLATSDMAVSEIAYALDYADAANFTRAFRRRTGISPRAYRLAVAKGAAG